MKKKAISLLLSAAMVGVLAGCAGTGTETEPANGGSSQAGQTEGGSDYQLTQINLVFDGTLTATVDAGQAEFVDQWEKAIEEKFGYHVDLNITQLDHSDYSGTVSRLLTTGEAGDGEYPDALIMSATMLRQYQTTGLLWDMANAYDNAEFQSRLTLDKINENLKTSSGALYGFAPTYGNGCVTYVKKAWLDAVGIDAASVTDFDSYYNMLQAFTNDDPDGNGSAGTYGVIAAGYGKLDEAPYINYMPEFWQDAYPSFYQNSEGVWVDGFTEQATIDALARLNKGYTDGVIDPDTEEAGTKQAREKWFSNDQSTSSGVFTYWAGTWYQTLTDKLIGNEVDSELVELAPIKEIKDSWGGYLNREAPVLTITDDGDGDSAREQAIFDILFDTMLDGDTVQTLWTYGAEGVHWSTEAETFTTNAGTDDAKEYSYEAGQFHLKQSPNDENTVWKKNFLDANLVIAPLTNGYADNTDLVVEGNQFFTENCVDAPAAASSETLTNYEADMVTDKTTWMNQAVVGEITPEQAVQNYIDKYGDASAAILEELNAQ
ncbi:hypothetical protein [Butyrivibrio fibrisolvens]|uniref:hypothetical protein n=1 Tax=Butyrivibrio fibrisolvens TaxID=831 RepID=UPI0003B45DC5|nr:hypothetical protein [Butyrivibrio fibrisolvens]